MTVLNIKSTYRIMSFKVFVKTDLKTTVSVFCFEALKRFKPSAVLGRPRPDLRSGEKQATVSVFSFDASKRFKPSAD